MEITGLYLLDSIGNMSQIGKEDVGLEKKHE